jgi:Calcineurin-like phosphoesterase
MDGSVSPRSGYDIIGDLHGYAVRLESLLTALSYAKRDGVWSHPERRAIFVGDYVDRGPENLRTCRIVMAMVETGSAGAVMGNHDFNAVCLATPDPEKAGAFLRPHTAKNLQQAFETRKEMEKASDEGQRVLAWLRRLPLWIETPELRVVHAAWSRPAIAALGPFLDERGALTDAGLARAARKGDPIRRAREYLLNGPEAALPAGISYRDPDGHERTDVRMAWWKASNQGLTWYDAVIADEAVRAQMPAVPIPSGLLDPLDLGKPIFFGHYWMQAPLTLQMPLAACVDASIAKNGLLAAYRYSGEAKLDPTRFVYA